jgi:chromate transporter
VASERGRLGELAHLFLLLGTTAFGGPAAHVAMMRDEVVRRRGWMDDTTFLDHAAACNLIPGPNSTELAIEIGRQRAGWKGLLVAGACFIGPAFVIVLVLAVLFERWGTTPAVLDVRYGVLPMVLAIVAQAMVGLTRTAVRSVLLGAITVAAFAASLAGVGELPLLAVSALVGGLWANRHRLGGAARAVLLGPVPLAATATADDVELGRLFLVFLKVGALLYGSGYVLLAFLEHDLVERLGWLTEQQLLDAVAVGQITPGPVFTTATFVGYQLAGVPGAVVATVGIFLPAFVFVALLGRTVGWLRSSPWARGGLDGLSAAAVGLLAAVSVQLASTAFPDAFTVAIAVLALAVLLRWQPNASWLVLAGALVGLAHGLATA